MNNIAAVTVGAFFCFAASVLPVSANPAINFTTTYFPVEGATPSAMYESIGRNGPRHAGHVHATALTRYKQYPDGRFSYANGKCTLVDPSIRIVINYTFPKPANRLPPEVEKRWNAFMKQVFDHEHTHGLIAIEMAGEMERYMQVYSVPDTPDCAASPEKLKRLLNAIWQKYEAAQKEFDRREHQPGGPVEIAARAFLRP